MAFSLLPQIILDSVTEITPELLQQRGIRLLMLDFDNTIVPYTTNVPTTEFVVWLETMRVSGILVCVVSNSKRDRVPVFCGSLGIPCVTHARKPFSSGIRRCLAKYSVPPASCALAGDQIFTDTLGANAAGITSVLVRPIYLSNFWLRLRHWIEQPFIFFARNRRITS